MMRMMEIVRSVMDRATVERVLYRERCILSRPARHVIPPHSETKVPSPKNASFSMCVRVVEDSWGLRGVSLGCTWLRKASVAQDQCGR
jgi:hypothetical protein